MSWRSGRSPSSPSASRASAGAAARRCSVMTPTTRRRREQPTRRPSTTAFDTAMERYGITLHQPQLYGGPRLQFPTASMETQVQAVDADLRQRCIGSRIGRGAVVHRRDDEPRSLPPSSSTRGSGSSSARRRSSTHPTHRAARRAADDRGHRRRSRPLDGVSTATCGCIILDERLQRIMPPDRSR